VTKPTGSRSPGRIESDLEVFLLLKNDGTLWRWGTNCFDWNGLQTNWPTVRASKPQQIGTNSDWKKFLATRWTVLPEKTDGSVWSVFFNQQTGRDGFERQINLDQVVFQTFSYMDDARMAYVARTELYGYATGIRTKIILGSEQDFYKSARKPIGGPWP